MSLIPADAPPYALLVTDVNLGDPSKVVIVGAPFASNAVNARIKFYKMADGTMEKCWSLSLQTLNGNW